MFQAVWVQVFLLDGRQTWTYYKHSYGNDTYNEWAKDYMERTNSTHEHTVSKIYFQTAMSAWLLTPTLLALFTLVSEKVPLAFWPFFGSSPPLFPFVLIFSYLLLPKNTLLGSQFYADTEVKRTYVASLAI